MVYESAESAIASHDGTLMAQNNRSRIFFGPGEAGDEKNCKVKMAILPFFYISSRSLLILSSKFQFQTLSPIVFLKSSVFVMAFNGVLETNPNLRYQKIRLRH